MVPKDWHRIILGINEMVNLRFVVRFVEMKSTYIAKE